MNESVVFQVRSIPRKEATKTKYFNTCDCCKEFTSDNKELKLAIEIILRCGITASMKESINIHTKV